MVDTGEGAHPRPLAQFHDLFTEFRQKIGIDLEEIVTRIGFERVFQHTTGMAVRIETEMPIDVIDLFAQQRDFTDGVGIGRRGEKTDDPQFADDMTVLVKPLYPDIVHIGASMDNGFHIRLGDDEELRPVEEFENFRRGRHLVLALAQNQNVRIGQNAEAPALAAFHGRLGSLAGIDVFAHAEEGEVVVPQPIEEGQSLFTIGAFAGFGIQELLGGAIHGVEHGGPVGNRQMHLVEDEADALDQMICLLLVQLGDMELDEADLMGGVGRLVIAAQRRLLARLDRQDRMYGHGDATMAGCHLAHDGIEQERHVPIDHGQDPDGYSVGFDAWYLGDGDISTEAVPRLDAGCSMRCGDPEHFRGIACEIVVACASEQNGWIEKVLAGLARE
ncbi:hypothetical protein D3C73_722170 [compost metagenome]